MAMLIGMVRRRIRPDLILFADVGAEKDKTYAHKAVADDYLRRHGYPEIITVRYVPTDFKNWAHFEQHSEQQYPACTLCAPLDPPARFPRILQRIHHFSPELGGAPQRDGGKHSSRPSRPVALPGPQATLFLILVSEEYEGALTYKRRKGMALGMRVSR
jgi:hypothetical protein